MARTYVVTGAASGIGHTTAELLKKQGHTVIGVDIHMSDVNVDLTTEVGRVALVDQVRAHSGGSIDAILAIAGLASPTAKTVAVNYFGMLATLEGLRPMLSGSSAPRAVGVASMASIMPVDDELVALMTSGDEAASLARAEELSKGEETGGLIYSSTKKAFAQWIRRTAPTAAWAGEGIPLNAIAPGVIATPMTTEYTSTPEARKAILEMVPMPLNGIAEPIVTANLLAWLSSEENTHLCGQVIFVDGGSDAVIRGDSTW
jgi:NAD(P)-dependent dehydrogenase (short-subunit alcohol dehydrogenase family)